MAAKFEAFFLTEGANSLQFSIKVLLLKNGHFVRPVRVNTENRHCCLVNIGIGVPM